MKKALIFAGLVLVAGWNGSIYAKAMETEATTANRHNWEQMSTDFEIIPTDSHEFTYWKNFIRHTRTCEVSLKIKTTVYYCDLHNHTRTSTELDGTVHSYNH
ncbi:hypothetical protein ACFO3D_05720 [Virgibacillus kekensis]|uniref:Uncharacterized protein n=1 Tax=Virgibacillus kekensis TaxID=202261 RepID=A0ABV9DG23_9BACI